MFWMIFSILLAPCFSQADATIQIPDAMRAKWSEVSKTVSKGYEDAKIKVDEVGREELGIDLKKKVQSARQSSFAQSIGAAAGRVWSMAKNKGRGVIVMLDRKFHEKVLGPDDSHKHPATQD